ncbi:phosphotransferase [Phycicoccus endophyticus]|uniref:non-specific serine/threonine protein kinase n=1 Tax=Phycicoccus endophyticus TaxID=1690220 RepID=A0A7G9QYY0_9MICO|nr:RIO1 family regulatory kinase/ATPase [Phycicoccus endophyticus]NHI18892.1 phosphotransferase [Phycicoccus endophyticus]QNN48555.1 phosphotransferase [Phycicoccus endophyticus]GGL31193.1 RIO kinase 1 [Phycicoccus endophyticus]
MAHQPFHLPQKQSAFSTDTSPDAPPEGERWSTWDGATHGPKPRPDWVVTELGAVDADLGVLKSGKEADVHVVRRWVPGTGRSVTMAAKRYRSGDHRLFHRDAGYLEGRRVRRSRETRAMAKRTDFGKQVIAGQWAVAEFTALSTVWALGLPVPYPVQLDETEMLMELVGDTGGATPVAAPRLVQTRPTPRELAELFDQLRSAMLTLARHGWTHGDLSPYNTLVHDGRLVLIDWPQVVDVIGNPRGFEFLERDAGTMATWFARKGLRVDAGELFAELVAEATGGW